MPPHPSIGAWWVVREPTDLSGTVILENASGGYLCAVDDGTLTVADATPGKEREGPTAPEIFTMIKVTDARVALKTAYGRYVSLNENSRAITAREEAMGVREMWQPVIRDGVGYEESQCPPSLDRIEKLQG